MAKLVLNLVCRARANLPTMEQIVFRITNRKGESWNVKEHEHFSKQLVVSNQTSNSEVLFSSWLPGAYVKRALKKTNQQKKTTKKKQQEDTI